MRILVTGSQDWIEKEILEMALLNEVTDVSTTPFTFHRAVLVHGTCKKGADLMAVQFAQRRQWEIESHPADWARYGNAAGQIRNERMVKLGADVCLAFIRDGSPGSSTTLFKAHREGIRTVVWRHDGDRVWYDDGAQPARTNPDQGSLF